ncbi:LIM domain only protein 7-like isoform X2 [Betta splendens]|uniref:LIM domain only protein 7-like isoform X2 n=1 Tax=Betta splendens TaxID=158456 RepID=A0A6P7LXR7_BETSP|nr:LIM domain only protein 7-like isoform X2 [Betta splendens]
MEWRQQTSVSCADAFAEAQRWIEEVTEKSFDCNNFRAALENGVLLCDLINRLKPGIIKRLNRLSTPMAGLDNVNVFLKACGKLGLNESQLFHPGDLQDLSTRVTLRQDESSRRLKNVLITIYWLGRKAHQDAFYSGPQLHFKAFEGLLGLALSKALDEGSSVFAKDGWYPEREDAQSVGPSYRRGNSVDSVDSVDSRAVYPSAEGFGSDAEAEQEFKMEAAQTSARRSKGNIPPPILRRKHRQESGKGYGSPLSRETQNQVRPLRPVQVNPGWIWSKSLSDIPMVYPARKGPGENALNDADQDARTEREWLQEGKEASDAAPKDSEAHWHEDLNKWKSRRRSTTSDLRTKSQDREHVIHQMTNGAAADFKNEPQKNSYQQTPRRPSPAPRPFSDLRPHTRALLSRSYATEAPFSPTVLNPGDSDHARAKAPSVGAVHACEGRVLGEETHVALASDGAGVTTPSSSRPFSSQTQVRAQVSLTGHQPEQATAKQVSTLITTLQPKEVSKSTSTRDFAAFSQRSQKESPKTRRQSAIEQGRGPQATGVYKNWSSSASLPRGFRRSEGSSRLSSAITARPFGTRLSRVSSLKRYNVDHSDMRVSLTLKPNSRQDFGFQTRWDSTGARVKCIEPGSPAELCQLCVDDEIVALDDVPVAHMSDEQWKANMTHALQHGSLTMDVRRYGNKDWSSGEQSGPKQPGQSRMTLNLTPTASVLIGCTDPHAGGAASADAAATKVSKFNGQTENVKQGKVTDGENGDSYRKPSKAYNKIIRRNQKRRTEFFKSRGGSESAISDLQVPSLHPSSCSWSWDCEEDRRRQEKWQEEQERLLQEKCRRDQERLEAEWRKAQQDAFGDSCWKSGDNMAALSGPPAGAQPRVNGVTSKAAGEWSTDQEQPKEAGAKPLTDPDCLSPAHRTKSLSTPELSGPHKQAGGDQRKRKGQSVSKAELERQQILEEMKKRTQLLTDNSWIRQRSSSFHREPGCVGLPLKRHDSLDALDALHQSPALPAPYGHPRPHSAAAGFCAPSRNSSSRYSTGAATPQRSASRERSHRGSGVWAAADSSEEPRPESRLDSRTGTPTVSPAIFNPSPLMPPCEQQAVLHITE